MHEINIPISLNGPGSQPAEEDGAMLDILQLPDEMSTFDMPEMPERDAIAGLEAGMARLEELEHKIHAYVAGSVEQSSVDLAGLDEANRALVDQVLGEGEVSMMFRGPCSAGVQESVLAGVWRIRYFDEDGGLSYDTIEVGPVPRLARNNVFDRATPWVETVSVVVPEGVLNAPPLLAEINDKVASYRPGVDPHVINLTLLPQTEQDIEFLIDRLGEGPLTILSRGYGNCRITATGVQNVWWVQYFNSQDKNILNTLEIGEVPAVAAAAPEDIADSAERLGEIMEVYR